jgi:hypothetical protein
MGPNNSKGQVRTLFKGNLLTKEFDHLREAGAYSEGSGSLCNVTYRDTINSYKPTSLEVLLLHYTTLKNFTAS